MHIPKYIEEMINKVTINSQQNRKLNLLIHTYFESKGIDTNDEQYSDMWSYCEGDCSSENFIKHIKSL